MACTLLRSHSRGYFRFFLGWHSRLLDQPSDFCCSLILPEKEKLPSSRRLASPALLHLCYRWFSMPLPCACIPRRFTTTGTPAPTCSLSASEFCWHSFSLRMRGAAGDGLSAASARSFNSGIRPCWCTGYTLNLCTGDFPFYRKAAAVSG